MSNQCPFTAAELIRVMEAMAVRLRANPLH